MAEETHIEHPNRDKAGSKAAKAVIVLLMLVTAALVAIITIGGWSVLQGAQIVAFFYILLYVVMAFYVARWNRGLLPVCAALSVLLAVVAGVAAPGLVRPQQGRASWTRRCRPTCSACSRSS